MPEKENLFWHTTTELLKANNFSCKVQLKLSKKVVLRCLLCKLSVLWWFADLQNSTVAEFICTQVTTLLS